MVKQTHTVATDALATLGTIIDESAGRDAIHLAVEPSIAAVRLFPGQDVGFVEGGMGPCDKPVGIVDPFLKSTVLPGQRFWLVIYPRQITSLRHVWEHPEIPAAGAPVSPLPPAERPLSQMEQSEAWLRDFVKNADCPSYETVIAHAIGEGSRQWSDEYLHFDGMDAHGEIPPEFWDHVEIVTGQTIPREKRAESFSCGC